MSSRLRLTSFALIGTLALAACGGSAAESERESAPIPTFGLDYGLEPATDAPTDSTPTTTAPAPASEPAPAPAPDEADETIEDVAPATDVDTEPAEVSPLRALALDALISGGIPAADAECIADAFDYDDPRTLAQDPAVVGPAFESCGLDAPSS